MYYPYSMQVTHFLKRKNCKVSLHFVKYVKSKETGKTDRIKLFIRLPATYTLPLARSRCGCVGRVRDDGGVWR